MKQFILLVSLITTTLFSHSVMANGYWGIKAAMVNVDAAAYSSDAINVGIFLGVDVTEIGSSPLAVEVDFNTTLIQGDGSAGPIGFDWGTQTSAVYAALRTGNDDYLKFKLGLHNTKTSVELSGNTSSGSGTGLAYGISFKFSDYEIEYTVLNGEDSNDADISLISLGFHFN
ncbi:MAG: porin family protein [Gammaproteobacteria bacterium]|nr:porin family protein [Gammaproteobacteria bacterium]